LSIGGFNYEAAEFLIEVTLFIEAILSEAKDFTVPAPAG